MSYVPQPDSVAGRMCAFFRAHPAAELSSSEAAERFGCKASDLSALLASAVQAKALTSETREFGGARARFFSAGPAIAQTARGESPPVSAAPRPQEPASGYGVPTGVVPRPAPVVDSPPIYAPAPQPARKTRLLESQVRIHDSLPKPSRTGQKPIYKPMLDRLQVGQAMEYPKQFQGSITHAARKLAAATGKRFSTHTLDATRCATWRDE